MAYWSYLTNNQEDIFLTFETHEYFDRMKFDYEQLNTFDFFNQFEGFTKIFVSSKNPTNNPCSDKLFEVNFHNARKARLLPF